MDFNLFMFRRQATDYMYNTKLGANFLCDEMQSILSSDIATHIH